MKKSNEISRRMFLSSSAALAGSSLLPSLAGGEQHETSSNLRLASFSVDATPPVGSRLVYEMADRVDQPLSCRGVVLLTQDQPIVLVALDWIGIANGGHDLWRFKLAQAASTSPDRVAVHVLHPHDTVEFDTTMEYILLAKGDKFWGRSGAFQYGILDHAADALKQAIKEPVPITHIGAGSAKVEKFASNRRILGKNGKVKYARLSNTKGHPELREYPPGLIDPKVRLVSFWNNDTPMAVLSYYATHPQSYYLQGGISCDTVGIARNKREKETGVFHLHFNGAGGNIAAGKYNDGSHKMRQILAGRLATGMGKALKTTKKVPIASDQIEWWTHPAWLPPEIRVDKGKGLKTFGEEDESQYIEQFNKKLKELKAGPRPTNPIHPVSTEGASNLAWLHRCIRGHEITLSCLWLGKVVMLNMPGELFVEYQLAAQKMREDLFVAMAAYGDYGPGYIGTRAAYTNSTVKGYELGSPSRVAPQVEDVLNRGMRELLQAKNLKITPSYFTRQKKRYD